MKKLFVTVCALSGLLPAMAQTSAATVNGHTSRKSKEPVKLYSITHGRLQEVASSRVDEKGKFGFLFHPTTEAYYVMGTGNEQSMTGKYPFYFKAGDQLNIDINDSSYALVGKNTGENKAIAQWHDKLYNIEQHSSNSLRTHTTFKEFFPELEALVASQKNYKPVPSGNAKFDKGFAYVRETDMLYYAVNFMSMPNSVFPKTEDYTTYYKNIRTENHTKDARLLGYPGGARLIGFLPLATQIIAGKEIDFDITNRLAQVSNDTVKGETVLEEAGRLKTYIGYQELEKNYGKYILTEDQKQRLSAISTKLAVEAAKPGQAAINFTYPDIQGKQTSLTDFKGKVVIVDVWATWCGPCKKEIPALKKMEEEMRGQDIVFMSVSVDEAKDEQKWKEFVAKEELKGVQLFASGWSDIARNYNIKGIPRFMVFDKKGNIVSVDAPRPSGKELKLLLESELKK